MKIGDQRLLASWSPNYENIKNKVIKSEQYREMNARKQTKQLDLDDDDIYEKMSAKLAALDNPTKKENQKLSVQVLREPNQQITNRNISYEEQLKALSENMLEVLEEKPNYDDCLENFKAPTDLKVKLLPHQCYSMKW